MYLLILIFRCEHCIAKRIQLPSWDIKDNFNWIYFPFLFARHCKGQCENRFNLWRSLFDLGWLFNLNGKYLSSMAYIKFEVSESNSNLYYRHKLKMQYVKLYKLWIAFELFSINGLTCKRVILFEYEVQLFNLRCTMFDPLIIRDQ